jgi:hypothetical protein
VFAQLVWAKASMAKKEATVDVAAMVDMELKTTTPKAPR